MTVDAKDLIKSISVHVATHQRVMLQYHYLGTELLLQHAYMGWWNIDLWLNKRNELSSMIESERQYFSCLLYKHQSDSPTCLVWFVLSYACFASMGSALTPKLFIMSGCFARIFHISNSMVLEMWKEGSITNPLLISCRVLQLHILILHSVGLDSPNQQWYLPLI